MISPGCCGVVPFVFNDDAFLLLAPSFDGAIWSDFAGEVLSFFLCDFEVVVDDDEGLELAQPIFHLNFEGFRGKFQHITKRML